MFKIRNKTLFLDLEHSNLLIYSLSHFFREMSNQVLLRYNYQCEFLFIHNLENGNKIIAIGGCEGFGGVFSEKYLGYEVQKKGVFYKIKKLIKNNIILKLIHKNKGELYEWRGFVQWLPK